MSQTIKFKAGNKNFPFESGSIIFDPIDKKISLDTSTERIDLSNYNKVEYVPTISSGELIGTLKINNENYGLYYTPVEVSGGDTISFSSSVSSSDEGAYKIGSITINGVSTNIYGKDTVGSSSPSGSTVTVNPTINSGVKVASISVDGVSKDIYAPEPNVSYTDLTPASGTIRIGTLTINDTDVPIYAYQPTAAGGGADGKSAYDLYVESLPVSQSPLSLSDWLSSLKGEDGESGASAYQVAVNNGYVGSVASWLESLKGQKGDKGEDGTGISLKASALDCIDTGDAYVDSDGNIQIYNSNTHTFTNGGQIKGPKGDTGEPGPKGDTGATPSLKIENGDLKVSYDDASWTSLGTVKGDRGEQGPQGEVGPQGPKGNDGTGIAIKPNEASCENIGDGYIDANGHLMILNNVSSRTFTDAGEIKGPQGDKGDKGDKGDIGPQGPRGYSGSDGDDGRDGADGKSPEIRVSGGYIKWKYTNEGTSAWRNIISIDDLKGADGEDGQDGATGANGVDGKDGKDGKDGTILTWVGELSSGTPNNPQEGYIYKNTTAGTCHLYLNGEWHQITKDGIDGDTGANGSNGNSVYIIYNSSDAEPNTPTNSNWSSTDWSQTSSSSSKWISIKCASSFSTGTWGSPIKIKGEKGDKGDAGSGSSLTITNNGIGKRVVTLNGTDIKLPEIIDAVNDDQGLFHLGLVDFGTDTLYGISTIQVDSKDGSIEANGGFYETSDIRFKNHISDLDVDLEALSKLPKAIFSFKDDESNTPKIGTYAQNLMELYPELVNENKEGMLSVDYAKLSIIALAAVDKLYNMIKNLELK